MYAGLPLDTNGDLDLGGDLLTGAALVQQRLTLRFQSILGDWFLDTSFGVDYFNAFGAGVRFSYIEGMLKTIINDTPGVVSLVSFDLSYNATTSRLYLEFEVTTASETLAASADAGDAEAFILLWR